MPRTGHRRSLTTAAALLVMLAAPAAAQAATYTVKAGNGPCGGADLACEDLATAADAAAPGDVFNVAQGIYGSATFDVGGVTIAGDPAFTVNGTITFTSNAGAVSKLQKCAINQNVGAGNGVVVSGSAGLEMSDCVVLSNNGDAVTFSAGTTNKIVRSVIGTGGQVTAAVRVTSPDTADSKKLVMESTLVTGGLTGLSVNTGLGNGLVATAGPVEVVLRHVTSAGSTHGLVLDSSMANPLIGGPVGNITATVSDSIIQNGTLKTNYPGVILVAPPNTITDTYTRTLMGVFDPVAVWVDPSRRNFRLKAGSIAINQGGVTPGESPTDIDGQDRSAAPTDQGADEYVAAPPGTGTPPPGPGANTDGLAPAVVITKYRANQRVNIYRKRTRTVTVTRNGKRVRVKRTTRTRVRIGFAGTAKDASGIKGVVLTVEKLSSTPATPRAATTTRCKWLNATKGIVLKSCAKPPLLVARVARDGAWTFNVRSSIRLGAGRYRIIAVGLDNSGAFGNSAPTKDSVHRFTLVRN